jgi:uncharacterized SAM-binding protein YcdF (DUF218 family)
VAGSERADGEQADRRRPAADSDPAPEAEAGLFGNRRLALIGLGLLALYVGLNMVDVWLTGRGDYDGQAPAAVVLGAAQYNGEPSEALRGRLDTAGQLYADGQVELVVVTGGGQPADETTEAKTGYDYLRENFGLPDEALRLEVQGRSTYQSLAAAARFLDDEGIEQVVVVTDPYHARRSQLVAEEVGLEADVAVTDAGMSIDRVLREAVAISLGRVLEFRRIDAYLPV